VLRKKDGRKAILTGPMAGTPLEIKKPVYTGYIAPVAIYRDRRESSVVR
jgi:hypothetical protein